MATRHHQQPVHIGRFNVEHSAGIAFGYGIPGGLVGFINGFQVDFLTTIGLHVGYGIAQYA